MKGLFQCFEDFSYMECYYAISLELICLILLIITIVLIIKRGKNKLLSKSTAILILTLSSFFCIEFYLLLVYFLYNLSRSHRSLYFLEEFMFQLYQALLIFYFAKKLVIGQRRNLLLIRGLFMILVLLDVTSFILSLFEATKKNSEKMCKQISFSIFRSISLATQIIFLVIVNKLYSKFRENFSISLLTESQTLKKEKQFNQLKLLCYVSFVGAIVLLIVNFIYFASKDCRIINHFGNDEYNISDSLNALIHTIIKLGTYFLPLCLTLIIFKPKLEQVSDNIVIEEEDLQGTSYFGGLSIKR